MAQKTQRRVAAIMSVPRFIFTENIFCAIEALLPLGIEIHREGGVFWEQGLTKAMDMEIANGAEWLIAIDYDTIFTRRDVVRLMHIADAYPEASAICGCQIKRACDAMLFTLPEHENVAQLGTVSILRFFKEITELRTGHFGLTLIKAEAIKKMKRPWFQSSPDPEGRWGEGRIDSDLSFWFNLIESGGKLFQANNVRLGHIQQMVTYPGTNFVPCHQYIQDYVAHGKPAEVLVEEAK